MAQYAEFRDKVVLITGAGSGIGRVTAEAFAAQGAIVVVSDINDLAGKQTVQKILSNGQKAEFIQCDVSDESQVKTMIENIVKHHGKVDIAFNNAGLTQNSEPLSEQSLETFCSVFDVSVRGVFLSMKYQIAQMEKQGQGSIVNMGSMSSVVGIAGLSTYSASKHAVLGLTRSAAQEYAAKGIRINAVGPGTCSGLLNLAT